MKKSERWGDQTRNRATRGTKEKQEETALLNRLRRGEEEALKTVMHKYNQKLYSVALRICKNDADAEEVLQDVYVTLIRKIDHFENRSSLLTWLHRITINQALMKVRSRKKFGSNIPMENTYLSLDGGNSPLYLSGRSMDEMLETKEILHDVEDAADDLKKKYQEVYFLRDVLGFTIKETSMVLHITPATTKSRLHRCRNHIKQKVREGHSFAP